MSQHIGIEKVDGKSQILAECEVNFAPILNNCLKVANCRVKYPIIISIDPYSDTILNHTQILNLINELNEYIREEKNQEVETLVKFLFNTKDSEFVKFIGD